jgi:hypothetical protein
MKQPPWLVALALGCAACASQTDVLRLDVSAGARAGQSTWRRELDDAHVSAPGLAVGATGDALIALRLDREQADAHAWQLPASVSGEPALAPGLVVFVSGTQFVGAASDSGRRLWSVPAQDAALLAATASPDWTALLVADHQGERKIIVYDRQRRAHLQIEAEGGLGTPALLGTTLLAPSGDGQVSGIDVAAARELGSAQLGSRLLHALHTSEGWFFGGPPWVAVKSPQAPPYALPRRPLPGRLQTGPEPLVRGRREDVTRLYVRPTLTSDPERDDIYMATFGRIAFGMDRQQGALVWVVVLPARALAARLVDAGLVVCDESGSVRLLAPHTGHVERQWLLIRQRRMTLGEPVLGACALDGDSVLGADAKGASRAPSAPALLEQIERVLAASDPDLTEAQRFLSRELAARPEPEATRLLIELVSRHSLDRRLEAEAEDLLATRRNGQNYMLAALSQSGDAAPPPPIAPLGEALAALGEAAAAPLLARQLNRPAHGAAALARAAVALEKLATEAEYDELSVFFSLHRTTADSPDAVAAVLSVGRTLLRVGGQRARTLVQLSTRDPLMADEIRQALERELASRAQSATGL